MTLAALILGAFIAWPFGYLYAVQSIKTQVIRNYAVTTREPLRLVK